MDMKAWRGESRVTEPRTSEFGAGGCGRRRGIVSVYSGWGQISEGRGARAAYGAIDAGDADETCADDAVSGVRARAELGTGASGRERERLAREQDTVHFEVRPRSSAHQRGKGPLVRVWRPPNYPESTRLFASLSSPHHGLLRRPCPLPRYAPPRRRRARR
jgi:hypothetical protein